jgi:hypothetical protein
MNQANNVTAVDNGIVGDAEVFVVGGGLEYRF